MIRTLTILFACTFLAVACTKKAVPSTSGTTPPEKTEKTAAAEKPAEPYKPVESATADIKKETAEKKEDVATLPSAPDKPSDDETGSVIFTTKCTKCHAAKTISNYTMRQWESILKSMVPKAKLSDVEEEQVTAYIRARAKQ